jgi:hypothetical protein
MKNEATKKIMKTSVLLAKQEAETMFETELCKILQVLMALLRLKVVEEMVTRRVWFARLRYLKLQSSGKSSLKRNADEKEVSFPTVSPRYTLR